MHHRMDERADLRRRLEAGQSIQLFAPRRVGKTWLLRALEKDLEAEGWAVALVDVEGMTTTREVLRALCARLEATGGFWEQAKGQLMHRLSRVVSGDWRDKTPLQAVGAVEPDAFAEELVATLDAQDRDTAILVDEIALFVLELVRADPHAARAFLYQLRRLQQAYPRVRWGLTGSIGLDVVARRLDLQGALVDMRRT